MDVIHGPSIKVGHYAWKCIKGPNSDYFFVDYSEAGVIIDIDRGLPTVAWFSGGVSTNNVYLEILSFLFLIILGEAHSFLC